jgi:hypothetical protein
MLFQTCLEETLLPIPVSAYQVPGRNGPELPAIHDRSQDGSASIPTGSRLSYC